jgi:hypothetical protein
LILTCGGSPSLFPTNGGPSTQLLTIGRSPALFLPAEDTLPLFLACEGSPKLLLSVEDLHQGCGETPKLFFICVTSPSLFLTCEGLHYYLEENPQHCFSPLEDPLHCVVTVKDPNTVSTCGGSLSLFPSYRGSPSQFSPQDPLHCFHLKIPITVFYLLSIPVIVFSCRGSLQ